MWALYKSLNLDLNLDPNKLDLGLGLVLGWGQTRGAPKQEEGQMSSIDLLASPQVKISSRTIVKV